MRILTNENKDLELDLIGKKIKETYFGVFSVANKKNFDYFFKPLVFLETFESVGAHLKIGGYDIIVPANWSIIIGDGTTTDIEVIKIDETNDQGFTAFCFNPFTSPMPSFLEIKMIDIFPEMSWSFPRVSSHNFLLSPLPTQKENLSVLLIDEKSHKKLPNIEFTDLV